MLALGCTGAPYETVHRPIEELEDPQTCGECHPDHLREWSGSMHAYAAEDPVFRAMNARGQRETDGALGDFCVQCHAPMAVRRGLTTDGLNLDELPAPMRGVTCYFCHSVDAVEGTHNNPLVTVDDGVMRGGIEDPVFTDAHGARYSPRHDRNDMRSSGLCGSCHDVVNPAGAFLERSFEEWRHTAFALPYNPGRLACSGCHMAGRDAPATNLADAPIRRIHAHDAPGVDLALTPFPEAEAQAEAVADELDHTLLASLCVADTEVTVELENVAAGHAWPSGAAQDRRAWIELVAWREGEEVFRSGVVDEGEPLAALDDPYLWSLRDHLFDEDGHEVHMFWEATTVERALLPPSTPLAPWAPGYVDPHVRRTYTLPGAPPDRVTVRVRMRPIGLEILDDLIASGDLDPVYRNRIPTHDLAATALEWTAGDEHCVP